VLLSAWQEDYDGEFGMKGMVSGSFQLASFNADPNRFAERRRPARIGHPKDWVLRGLWI